MVSWWGAHSTWMEMSLLVYPLARVEDLPWLNCKWIKAEPLLWPRSWGQCKRIGMEAHSETFPVDDGRTSLIILLLTDPHLLERGQAGQNGAPNPNGVLPLWGEAVILVFTVLGARATISFCIQSTVPGYIVLPPERMVLAYRSLRISTLHFMTELNVVSWIPLDSVPRKEGWKWLQGIESVHS